MMPQLGSVLVAFKGYVDYTSPVNINIFVGRPDATHAFLLAPTIGEERE